MLRSAPNTWCRFHWRRGRGSSRRTRRHPTSARTSRGIGPTHSEYATAFAQARRPIRCLGTTHADYFRGDVPVTRAMTRAEVENGYEKNTGLVIVEAFSTAHISPEQVS